LGASPRPTLGADGIEVGLLRNPYSETLDDDTLYAALLDGAQQTADWIERGSGDLFPATRAFAAMVILAGPTRHVAAKDAALAVIMVGAQANRGYTLEQAWAKAVRHWESGVPNGKGVYLGGGAFDGDCNWGLSDEVDGMVFGVEGLTQFPARHAGRVFVSGLTTRIVVTQHQRSNQIAGRNISEGRPPWVTSDGRYAGHHDAVRSLSPILGSIPAPTH
jgi:hypothetical protein